MILRNVRDITLEKQLKPVLLEGLPNWWEEQKKESQSLQFNGGNEIKVGFISDN